MVTYEILGIWSGYCEAQRRLVHLEYSKDKKFVEDIIALKQITFTDETTLDLFVIPLEKRHIKMKEVDGYTNLIRTCIRKKVSRVADLGDD